MATIERDVSLLQRRRVAPIYIVYGSAVQIQLNMIDYTIPENATVEFFAQCGNGPVYRADGSATGNSAVFTPQEGFFQKGDNALQLEINGRLIPLALDVKCEERISGVGSEETPEQVKPYVVQCQEILAENKAVAVRTPYVGESLNWMVWDSEAKSYVDSGVGAVGPRGETGGTGATGPQGAAGAPATLESYVVEYMASDSGTNAPSGSWNTTVPNVDQGKYLWTRVTQTYNTGSPVVSYSVSRMGIDGSGSVSSVAGVSPDSNGNVALTPDDVGAEKKQKYGKLVVFGDSLGQGTNNGNYSFVDILSESGVFAEVVKACVGSATIGPYQTDSAAAGYDLVSQVNRYADDVADADIIMLEYGGNDVAAYIAGNIQMGSYSDTAETVSVCGYLAKAMERIRSLNPTAKIVWLDAFWDSYDSAKNAVDAGYADAWLLFQATAIRLARPYLIGVIPIFSGLSDAHMSSDGVHPNTAGHRQIATKIASNPFGISDYPCLNRVLTLTGNVAAGTDLSIDAGYPVAKSLIEAGVTIRLEHHQYGGPMMLRPFVHNDYFIQFTGMAYQNGDYLLIAVNWEPDGSISVSSEAYSGNPYPVGAIYMSVFDTSPASLFGGTWERLKDRFLLAAGDTYQALTMGGEAEHTLTVNEMPQHNHDFQASYSDIATGSEANGKILAGNDENSWLWKFARTNDSGWGAAHNNMPPYLAVYMWVRTA